MSVAEYIAGGVNVLQLVTLLGIFYRLGSLGSRLKALETITESMGRRIFWLEQPRRAAHERKL